MFKRRKQKDERLSKLIKVIKEVHPRKWSIGLYSDCRIRIGDFDITIYSYGKILINGKTVYEDVAEIRYFCCKIYDWYNEEERRQKTNLVDRFLENLTDC